MIIIVFLLIKIIFYYLVSLIKDDFQVFTTFKQNIYIFGRVYIFKKKVII